MELWIGAVILGFLYAFMTMGVYITFRIYDFPDITVDGSFTTGAAVSALLIVAGFDPFLTLAAAFVLGAAAGAITALIHTRFNINGLLSGILVMTALYSINLHIMGRSNIPLIDQRTMFSFFENHNPGISQDAWILMLLLGIMILLWLVFSLFFRTDLGMAMRATGNNPDMAGAAGINVNLYKVFGVALSNGLVGVSGALVAQYQGFADIGMGIGTILVGLASLIIGESILKTNSVPVKIFLVILGSVVFRLMIAFALYVGMNPIDIKLITAVFVLLTLVLSQSMGAKKFGSLAGISSDKTIKNKKLLLPVAACAVVFLLFWGYQKFHQASPIKAIKTVKIGFLQVADNGLLNVTRDSFVKEMKNLGYLENNKAVITLENAHGDLPTVNSIIDKFIQEDYDIIVPVSTPCTQATVNKVKDRPVIFATVANPFIIGAGKSETDHQANVTGVYGWVPMDKTLELMRQVLPDAKNIGSIWDPAQANAVFNVEQLEKAVAQHDDLKFTGATVAGSSEIFQAATSLVQRGIDVFILPPDNIVYSAFDSVVKAARKKHIPIFLSDVERLKDGALAVLGYDYEASGYQAAHLVDRVIKGENPREIPFEKYNKIDIGFNLDTAAEDNINIPADLIDNATILVSHNQVLNKKTAVSPATPKRVALFRFNDHSLILESARGVLDELAKTGAIEKYNLTIEEISAQGDYTIAQAIAQDIIRQKYDYIITLSTPALQVTAQLNKTIPHIFGTVTDPYRMGVAETPEKHQKNVTGVATLQPVESTIQIMREVFPDAKRIGMIWNPAEACSEACTFKARQAAKKYDFELIEGSVSSTGEVMDALKALLTKNIDIFLTSGDNTVLLALEMIAKILHEKRIPYFTNSFSDVDLGAFISVGADYVEVGRQTARVAIKVFEGQNPEQIPINNFSPEKININQALADEYGIRLSPELLKKADKIKR